MIEVKGLYKSFEGKTVLHNIDASFERVKYSMTDATFWQWVKKKRNICDAKWE